VKLFDAVRRANRPGPPEHSITLRVACAGAVVTGIAACRAEGELSWTVAGGSMAAPAKKPSRAAWWRWLTPAVACA